MKLAVFDCDGTLVDGQAAVCRAMASAFADTGHPPPPPAQVRRIVGLSLPQAVRRLDPALDEAALAATVAAYKEAFFAARQDGSLREPLFDGIADLLRHLHGHGWTLGVATGKSDRGLAATLATHSLGALFATLHTADRHPSKPDPAMLLAAMADAAAAPEQTVMIGDTVYDIEMAVAAGTRALGVAWGYHEEDELLAAGAEAVARDAAHLQELLDG
ncbi:HAD-IA family hydrolase [Erythrobacter arachoides]|uniref:HAD-IA family hydrolase n=1 Tax=Aurantiacibacter arachoides TaxID=1850444 RepID=A0A844ZXD5_9SPHN|nr:HAD-IA family hydrolase [Aurantiacibacter arachoides]MXO92398.1 HAD-IA family hydrolase [Aurantiacibacter arachoides]GGD57481.1 haloacid dehalogenase [Aurantiacibacter arachoides]